MPLPQPQTSGMWKILLLIEHDIGEACTDIIAFVVKLRKEYLCFLVCRECVVGGYGRGCNRGVVGRRRWRAGCLCDPLLRAESRNMSLLVASKAFSFFYSLRFLVFCHGCSGVTPRLALSCDVR